jgi:hypothetical protein
LHLAIFHLPPSRHKPFSLPSSPLTRSFLLLCSWHTAAAPPMAPAKLQLQAPSTLLPTCSTSAPLSMAPAGSTTGAVFLPWRSPVEAPCRRPAQSMKPNTPAMAPFPSDAPLQLAPLCPWPNSPVEAPHGAFHLQVQQAGTPPCPHAVSPSPCVSLLAPLPQAPSAQRIFWFRARAAPRANPCRA